MRWDKESGKEIHTPKLHSFGAQAASILNMIRIWIVFCQIFMGDADCFVGGSILQNILWTNLTDRIHMHLLSLSDIVNMIQPL